MSKEARNKTNKLNIYYTSPNTQYAHPLHIHNIHSKRKKLWYFYTQAINQNTRVIEFNEV